MKRLTNNLSLKLVSLMLAILLWSHVRGEVNPLETSTVEVPLHALPPRDVILLKAPDLPEKVTVVVRGPRLALRNLKGGALANPLAPTDVAPNILNGAVRASLDFSSARKGDQRLPIKAFSNAEEVEVLGTKPADIAVSLDKAQSVRFSIKPDFASPPGAGVSLKNVNIDPLSVRVFGPSNALARIKSVRASIEISGAVRGAQSLICPLAALDRDGNAVGNVRLGERTARVSFSLREVPVEKRVALSLVPTGAPEAGFAIESIQAEPARVALRGLPRDLKNFKARLEIDVSDASQTLSRRVRVPPSDGVEITPSRVRVTVKFKRTGAALDKTENALAPQTTPDDLPVRRGE